ncbi:MAG TPA: S41 family peptidase [Bacteroidales bacterium]|nr:S41 family peptidase [Bacteroidales bacterium]
MKAIKSLISLLCFSLLFLACEKGEDVIGSDKNNEYVNAWMMDNLSVIYYWNNMLPKNTDKTLDPEAYFNSIMYWYDPVTAPDGDRFSWIEKDYNQLIGSLNGIVPHEIGFELNLYYKDKLENDVVGQVTYVKKGTPADSSGVKRGMFFDRVNGTVLTKSNYSNLLNVTSSNVTIGFVEPVFNGDGNLTGYTSTVEKSLQTVEKYAENPVYKDTVLNLSGHKIGYFVYHFFAPDAGGKDFKYDLELNQVFGRFKTAGVTDLVLDLRYNSGGRVSSARLLASEIVPDLTDSKLFVYYRYNLDYNAAYIKQYGAEDLKTYFTKNVVNDDNVSLEAVNNIGNQLGGKVYILTGSHTASASEMIINGLKPFMNVVLIGDTTYGKNVASYTLWDEGHTDKNKWGIQPIIAKYFNSLGKSDFTAGFAPNFVVQDAGFNMKEYGDPTEPLLRTALIDIVGNAVLPMAQKRYGTIHTDKLLSLPWKRIRGAQLDKSPFFK